MKAWREVAIPHEDVMKGNFQEAEFAADITRVYEETASPEYGDPELFFQRTFITEGMRLLIDSVLRRISGKGGEPVIQLQTAFGGGKTHTMLAVFHLVSGKTAAKKLAGIPPILDAAGITEMPKARIVVLDGVNLSPDTPRKRGAITVRTLWGELAWQLGREAGYELVAQADASGVSPGKEILTRLISNHAPCVILVDELAAYVRQFPDSKELSGGTFDSNLSFIQALTEALKAVPTAVLLAALPESWQAGGPHGVAALDALKGYFGRVNAIWKPVAAEESFEIVRRRLFSNIKDQKAIEQTCRAFVKQYAEHEESFPRETLEGRYYDRMVRSYPIHPEVFDRLYEDWTTLDNFQRTRGVLRLMAKAIYRLWKDGNTEALIMPGNIPLYDTSYRNEAIYYLNPGWDAVIEKEIDGERSEPMEIETQDPRFGAPQACRKVARTIFLGSAPASPQAAIRGIDLKHILAGCVQPGQQEGVFVDALHRLSDRLHYLNSADNRYWFDTRPNLRREMEERKLRFKKPETFLAEVKTLLTSMIGHGSFRVVHVFVPHADVPDTADLRLVVLPPGSAYSRSTKKVVEDMASEYVRWRGDQPRTRQNRLIFLAADVESLEGLSDKVASKLSWQSILEDGREAKITLDFGMAKTVEAELQKVKDSLARAARDTYRWLVVPGQAAAAAGEVVWEYYATNPGAPSFGQEIAKVLREVDAVVEEWSPIHLSNLLKTWFWEKDAHVVLARDIWQKMCSLLYMERLKDEDVFKRCLTTGSDSRDYFALADGREGEEYQGFSFGKRKQAFLDDRFVIIDPVTATAYEQKSNAAKKEAQAGHAEEVKPEVAGAGDLPPKPIAPPQATSRRYFGSKTLDNLKAQSDFATLMEEVVLHFTSKGHDVVIKIDIEARALKGFDESTVRTVKTNGDALKFDSNEFFKE